MLEQFQVLPERGDLILHVKQKCIDNVCKKEIYFFPAVCSSNGYEAERAYGYIAADGGDEGRSYKEYYFFHQFKMTLITSFTKVCIVYCGGIILIKPIVISLF